MEACSINEWPKKIVELLKQKGYDLILATNPIFPPEATMNRMQWPGLRPEDFRHITHYKNSHYCKPNPEYYLEIMKTCGLKPTECMMIGNDVREDMCAGKLGMETFLVTDCLINTQNADITPYRRGSIKDLYDFVAAEM
jgi:FMN phosphatase YigB (HAD superfamily)